MPNPWRQKAHRSFLFPKVTQEIRALEAKDLGALREILQASKIANVVPIAHLGTRARHYLRSPINDFLGLFNDGHLDSVALTGANLMPINIKQNQIADFAESLGPLGRRCSSIVGPVQQVLSLWSALESTWGSAREVRESQPLLSMNTYSKIETDSQVRYSTRMDLDALFPACVDMFTQEVGVSPILHGSAAYRSRVSEIISQRHSFIRTSGEEVIFKAEVGVVSTDVAQIQGVWINPKFRGQGLAASAMAAVVKYVIDDIAPVATLYVNSFNKPAVATYLKTGFVQVDTFATVLF